MLHVNRFIKGSGFGIGIYGIKALTNLVLIPILLSLVGSEQYGLFALLIGFTELAFMLDLGFSTALTKELSTFENDENRIQQALAIGHSVYLAIALFALVIGIGLLPWLNQLFNIPENLEQIARDTTFIAICMITVYSYSSYYRAVLLSQTLHQWNHLADGINHILGNLLGIGLLIAGFGLKGFFAAKLLSALLMLAIVIYQANKLPFNLYQWVKTSRNNIYSLVATSSYSALGQFSNILSHRLDTVVIGIFLPLSAIGLYEVVFRFLNVMAKILSRITQGAMPVFSRMITPEANEEAKQFFHQLNTFLSITTLIPLTLITLNFETVLTFFSAGQYSYSEALPLLLTGLPIVLSGVIQGPATCYLMAKGEFRYLALSSLAAAVVNVSLSLILVPWIGVLGVVIGTLVPQVYQHQQFIIAKTCHQLGDTYGNHLKTSIIKPLLFSGAIYALAGVINIGLTEINYLNITTITIYCLLLTATGLPLYYWLFGSETEKDFLQTLIKKANKPFQRGQNLGSL